MRILLVEDDTANGRALVTTLEQHEHTVDWAKDGVAADKMLESHEYNAVLLDLTLPDRDGLDLLRDLRSTGSRVPVIVITSRAPVAERVRALNLGADAYIVKPLDISELVAQLRAVVRRVGGHTGAVLTNGHITLDPVTHEVRLGKRSIVLTRREFAVLYALLLRPGALVGKAELENHVYASDEVVESNAIDFLIHGLRKKLGQHVIKNVRGVGWMVDCGA
jgi:two-component system OmpR family response regulator